MAAQMQNDEAVKTGKEEALEALQAELQSLQADLHSVTQKINASMGQLEQLTQRNATVIGEVRRLEGALETTPRLTLKETYSEALDSQQRLLTIRGQLDKLQQEQDVLRGRQEFLGRIVDLLNRKEESDEASFDAREMILKVMDAQEEERERLARAMHDGPAHSLTNFILQAEICLKWFEKDPERAREELLKVKSSANDSFQKVRGFISELRPMMLGDLGLVPTLKRYVADISDKGDVRVEFMLIGREMRLAEYLDVLLFRGVAALIANARDQRGAGEVKVTLELAEDIVRVTVTDNGRGFGTGNLKLDSSNSEALGLGALQERVNLVGGNLFIDAGTGQGTKIIIEVEPDYE